MSRDLKSEIEERNYFHFMEFHSFHGISFTFRILFNFCNSFHFSIVAKALFYVQNFLGHPVA